MKWARKKPTHTVSRKRTLHALAGLISMAILTTACTTAPYGRLPPAESPAEVPQAASEVPPAVEPEVRLGSSSRRPPASSLYISTARPLRLTRSV
jgi:hypothetical protein